MAPIPTPILRLVHVENLGVLLTRGALHSANHTPQDGLGYRAIHRVDVQQSRHQRQVTAGPCGVLLDYVPFYFGNKSLLLFQLKTGRVAGYAAGQRPLIHLLVHAQDVVARGLGFVFTNGHALANYTDFFDSLDHLNEIDWAVVNLQFWKATVDDPDRQTKKQAEFLVHQSLPWDLVREIGVVDEAARAAVLEVLSHHPHALHRPVAIRREWYYP
ncbi:MAG: DUF4433 domain-containing protein [Archangium sp.]|nr:DUF4433 domain-containing protein [Archangium sp.]MDP3569466.1 DUF4433 domain-containing protein [Archangium sp.]